MHFAQLFHKKKPFNTVNSINMESNSTRKRAKTEKTKTNDDDELMMMKDVEEGERMEEEQFIDDEEEDLTYDPSKCMNFIVSLKPIDYR
jgi:hypothetical protein